MKLQLAPATKQFMSVYGHTFPHATILAGPIGVGLKTLALHIASSYGQVLTVVSPESKTGSSIAAISIERIRTLYEQTKSRFDKPHFVIIDDADGMNVSAQNALLKLLEEPNESIRFILTTHSPDILLPTIRSRANIFTVPPISGIESQRIVKAAGILDETVVKQLLFIASGLPAALIRLSQDTAQFKRQTEQIRRAQTFIKATTYQRLALIQTSKDDRSETLMFIESMTMLLRRSLQTASNRDSVELLDRLLSASDAIRANGNIKLHLSRAVLY